MRLARKAILLIGLTSSLSVLSHAQEIIHLDGPGSVTIDASRLITTSSLNASWRVAGTDDPRFAKPEFDDSSWPAISPGKDRQLSDFHAPNALAGCQWIRLHLHIRNAKSPLGFHIESMRNQFPVQVFANGNEIQPFTAAGPRPFYPNWAFFPPSTGELVLAIRIASSEKKPLQFFQLEQINLGQADGIGNAVDLSRYRQFEAVGLTLVGMGIFFFACATLSFVLWLAQREHKEYFWLWLYCGMRSAVGIANVALLSGRLSNGVWTDELVQGFDAFSEIVLLQFVATIAGQSRSKALRAVQAANLIFLVTFYFQNYVLFMMTAFTNSILQLSLITVLLWAAYRRGRQDCGLLLVPLAVQYILELIVQLQFTFPQVFGEQWKTQFGGVVVTSSDIGLVLDVAGITAVILYRFIRVSKDEEVAAAELEAARTVQQLLIPAISPITPGFLVESAYLPAQQVGGDFFLVLPAAEASANDTLLAVMGDVSGKGLQAAMVVSTIIGGLRMQVSRKPAEVLTHVNQMLFGHFSGFATCCVVHIDADGQMLIANAGNPAPYVDGFEIATLPALPLGITLDVRYVETTFLLKRGQQITFVSDGVIEAMNIKKELYGFDRTREVSSQSASAIAEAASRFGSGAPQADDITVLTVSYA